MRSIRTGVTLFASVSAGSLATVRVAMASVIERVDPATFCVVDTLTSGSLVLVIDSERDSGLVRVLTPSGRVGWIDDVWLLPAL